VTGHALILRGEFAIVLAQAIRPDAVPLARLTASRGRWQLDRNFKRLSTAGVRSRIPSPQPSPAGRGRSTDLTAASATRSRRSTYRRLAISAEPGHQMRLHKRQYQTGRSFQLTRPALSKGVDKPDNKKGKTYTEKGSLAGTADCDENYAQGYEHDSRSCRSIHVVPPPRSSTPDAPSFSSMPDAVRR